MRPVINSIKNVVDTELLAATTIQNSVIAIAKDSPATSVLNDVQRGCIIKALWISFDVCGLAASGIRQKIGLYVLKNPGNNITPPGVFTVGTSNEKKFVVKQWSIMTMRNQDGNPPFHWEGWIKIPKRYQRMGTDDRWSLSVQSDSSTGHFSAQYIYKWYT